LCFTVRLEHGVEQRRRFLTWVFDEIERLDLLKLTGGLTPCYRNRINSLWFVGINLDPGQLNETEVAQMLGGKRDGGSADVGPFIFFLLGSPFGV
jgi:hypothetical protein